jgi:chemotaxis protein CheD
MMADLPEISVQPGELYLARSPSILRTILGSCVGVTFWNARLGVGALGHGMLPRCPPGAGIQDSHRYVDTGICCLAEQFETLGICRREVEVKLFGGADVLAVSGGNAGKPTIGALNCRAALAVLEQGGFRLTASDLGGIQGRTIHFHTGTGDVLVHRLAALRSPEGSDNEFQRSPRKRSEGL